MKFYYVSMVGVILIALIYRLGTGVLVWVWCRLRWKMKGAWRAMLPLFFLLYISPIAEELWIAWQFGQFCNSGDPDLLGKEAGYGSWQVAHKVIRREQAVMHQDSRQRVGSAVTFQRHAPWFYVGFEAPAMSCSESPFGLGSQGVGTTTGTTW